MRLAKKTAAVILSLIMVLTMVPFSSFADDGSAVPEEVFTDEVTGAEEVTTDEVTGPDESLSGDASEDASEEPEVLTEDTEEPLYEDTEDSSYEDTEAGYEEEYYEDEGDETDESDMGYEEATISGSVDPDAVSDADSAEMMEEFFYGDSDKQGADGPQIENKSVKGSRLTGNNLFYYNNFKSIIKEVAAAKRSSTEKSVPLSKMRGKRTFTAKDLGVSKIAYKKNGRWYLTAKAKNKIQTLFNPGDFEKVVDCLIVDMPSEAYWVNWGSGAFSYQYSYHCRFNSKSVTIYSSDKITFRIPVTPEFAKAADSTHNYVYKADTAKIRGANTAKSMAKTIVKTFDDAIPEYFGGYSNEAIDYYRLWYYCDMIAYLTEYDYNAAELRESAYWKSPWTMISVFDGDSSTKTVCEGYAKALKYLCDLSSFKSNWIDCQLVTSKDHMWNIVRMNDGQNYLVDPTWMDSGSEADVSKWFLRGAPNGTAKGYTIEGNKRVYDQLTIKSFAPAERTLSKKSFYEWVSSKPIKLKKTSVKKLTRGKRSFKVTWKKMSTPLGALYIDGYQIQYSLKKNFKGAKKVTVKGYAKSSKTIKRLKRKKYYYVRVRTFAKVGRKTYYSAWSPAKRIRTK